MQVTNVLGSCSKHGDSFELFGPLESIPWEKAVKLPISGRYINAAFLGVCTAGECHKAIVIAQRHGWPTVEAIEHDTPLWDDCTCLACNPVPFEELIRPDAR